MWVDVLSGTDPDAMGLLIGRRGQTLDAVQEIMRAAVMRRTGEKTRIVLDDARHFLLTTDETFDAITSDPLDPWVKGAATLYTREFFEEVKAHLNPGGVVTLFVQLYESTEDAVKSEIATFFEAFPNGAIFANTINGQGYDLVLFGQLDDTPINVDRVQARLDDPANAAIRSTIRIWFSVRTGKSAPGMKMATPRTPFWTEKRDVRPVSSVPRTSSWIVSIPWFE